MLKLGMFTSSRREVSGSVYQYRTSVQMIVRTCVNQPGDDGQPIRIHPQPLFCILLWGGQAGVVARGGGGEVQENTACST